MLSGLAARRRERCGHPHRGMRGSTQQTPWSGGEPCSIRGQPSRCRARIAGQELRRRGTVSRRAGFACWTWIPWSRRCPLTEALPDGVIVTVAVSAGSCRRGCSARERKLLELPDTIVFYDLTNTWYHGPFGRGAVAVSGARNRGRRVAPAGDAGTLSLDGAGSSPCAGVPPVTFWRDDRGVRSHATILRVGDGAARSRRSWAGEGGKRPTVILDVGDRDVPENIGWLRERGYG